MGNESTYQAKLREALIAIKKLKKDLEDNNASLNTDIAIIGMSCRFPGGIKTLEEYWDFLKEGKNGISEIPKMRWDNDDYYNTLEDGERLINTKYGGFIDDVEKFDNDYFGISPVEAAYMDPQQRLLLEVCCESLEHAGIDIQSLKDSDTGVFLGSAANDYSRKHLNTPISSKISPYSLTGGEMYSFAGRISYTLGLQGPSVLVSTACSSSLVAIHQACQSLILHESDLAIAGGSNLMIAPEPYIALSKMGALSVDGQCKAFDASANGYVRGEGIGIIALKRLEDAKRDGDKVLAVVKASSVNQDGKSNGFTAPSMKAQEKLIETALKKANLTIADIDLFEAHGTGTPLGDPIELQAITNVIKRQANREKPMLIGTVKSNFGHTEGTAGVAGVIKMILSMQNQQIPKSLHFNNPNPHYNWKEGLVDVPTELLAWQKESGKRRGAVNSFGVSGTNSHIILEEYTEDSQAVNEGHQGKYLLVLSAKSEAALRDQAKQFAAFLSNRELSSQELYDVAASAAFRKTQYKHRISIVGANQERLISKLRAFAAEEGEELLDVDPAVFSPKVAFVFSGHGSHWLGMGRNLMLHEPVFHEALMECQKAFSPYLKWSLLDELMKTESDHRFDEIEVIQPLFSAIQIALAKLWIAKGVEPEAIVGHSMGEVAAAHIAGCINLDEAARIICLRSQLMNETKGQGTMAVVGLSMADILPYLKPVEDRVSVAVVNSPNSTVIAGEPKAIQQVLDELEAKDIFNRQMRIDIASHSVQMEGAKDKLLANLAGNVIPKKGTIDFYSTVEAKLLEGLSLSPDYWASNLRNPVLFTQTTQKMLEDGVNTFIEISAHPVLSGVLGQSFEHYDFEAYAIPSLLKEQDEHELFWSAWGKLHTVGYELEWNKLFQSNYNAVDLPNYPWQHKSFWLETPSATFEESTAVEGALGQTNEAQEKSILEQYHEAENALSYLQGFVRKELLKASGYTSDQVADDQGFAVLGIDSMMAVKIKKRIEKAFELSFPTKLFWEHSTIEKLSLKVHSLLSGNVEESASDVIEKGDLLIQVANDPEAVFQLILFPGAGENPALYHTWTNYLPKEVAVSIVQLPGRGARIAEAPYTSVPEVLADLIPEIKEQLTMPTMFMGHSMGGLLAYETAKQFRASDQLCYLCISASEHLKYYKPKQLLHKLGQAELIQLFPQLSPQFFEDDEYHQLMLTNLLADLKMVETHSFEEAKPLTIPIAVFGGTQDDIISSEVLRKWESETHADFDFTIMQGDHHFIHDNVREVVKAIEKKIMVQQSQ